MKRIAVVKVRGNINTSYKIKDTMKMMGLTRVNHCVVLDERDTYKGMLQKAKDYITWGEISPEVFEKMLVKRGKVADELISKNTKHKSVKDFAKAYMAFEAELEELKINKVFRLSPPRKGYEDTKKQFAKGGSLGGRGEEINRLLVRMI